GCGPILGQRPGLCEDCAKTGDHVASRLRQIEAASSDYFQWQCWICRPSEQGLRTRPAVSQGRGGRRTQRYWERLPPGHGLSDPQATRLAERSFFYCPRRQPSGCRREGPNPNLRAESLQELSRLDRWMERSDCLYEGEYSADSRLSQDHP